MEPKHYAIPVSGATLRLCEELQGGPIPYMAASKDPYFIIVLDDEILAHTKGVVPGANLDPKFLILKPEEQR